MVQEMYTYYQNNKKLQELDTTCKKNNMLHDLYIQYQR